MRFPIIAFCTFLGGCGSCGKEPENTSDASVAPLPSGSSASVVAEPLPRCRKGPEKLVIAGEDVIVGDVAVGGAGLLAGVVRINGGKRVASVLKTSLNLADQAIDDVGTPVGDDPPPSPRWKGTQPWVAFFAGRSVDGGAKSRELVVQALGEAGTAPKPVRVVQQADESTAFDVAWTEGAGAGLVTWDEDGPPVASDAGAPKRAPAPAGTPAEPVTRGVVKVQPLTADGTARTVSPDTSDADTPRLVPRAGGGFWIAWIARKSDEEAKGIEGPGEPRQFRWIEVMPLDAKGEPTGPIRKVGTEKSRAVAFELARAGDDLVVMVQDEIAASDGARIVRHKVSAHDPAKKPETSDIVKDGVGHALADLVPASTEAARWLAWSDTNEHTHLTQLGPGLVAQGKPSSEPTLEGARVLASSGDTLFALAGTPPELLRFVCP